MAKFRPSTVSVVNMFSPNASRWPDFSHSVVLMSSGVLISR
jgi:hypothetical protein